jgi:hypothetical protein
MESAEHGLDRDKNLPLRRVGYKVAGFRVIASLLGGPGLPVPSRRTLASAIVAFARSMLPSLRLPGCARPATPLDRHGQPLPATAKAGRTFRGIRACE